jgi:hypothetical protein
MAPEFEVRAMSLATCWTLAVSACLGVEPAQGTLAWNGAWLAFVETQAAAPERLPSDWIFGVSPDPAGAPANRFRLWVYQTDTNGSVLLEDSQTPISSPGWSPNGSAIAYLRVFDGVERSRVELVVQDAPDHLRILWTRPLRFGGETGPRWVETAPIWSPDGLFIAVPLISPLGVTIVRVADGRPTKTLDAAFSPSWSTDGKLAYFQAGNPDRLCWTEARRGEPHPLTDVRTAARGPAPVWSLDNHELLFVRRGSPVEKPKAADPLTEALRARIRNGADRGPKLDKTKGGESVAGLAKVRIDTAETQVVIESIVHEPIVDAPNELFTAVAMDGERVFYTTRLPKSPSQITYYRPRSRDRVSRFHPLDQSMPIGALSLCPVAGAPRLAFRLAGTTGWSPPALCDLPNEKPAPSNEKLTLVVPDDAARLRWIITIAMAARDLIAETSASDEIPPARPTLLPLPGEFPQSEDAGLRLNRLARLGRELCDRPTESASLDPSTRDFLLEQRLIFDYLLEDYAAVRAALPILEPVAKTSDLRERLIGLRAQVDLALGDVSKARDAVQCLRASSPGPRRLIEESGGGFVLAPEPPPKSDWTWTLAERIDHGPSTVVRHNEPAPADDGLIEFPQLRPVAPEDAAARIGAPPPPRPAQLPFDPKNAPPRVPPAPQPR